MSTVEYKCELVEYKREPLSIKMSTAEYEWEPPNLKLH